MSLPSKNTCPASGVSKPPTILSVVAVCNVDDETADYDACRIEHVISDDVLEGIRSFMKTGSVSDRIVSGHDLSEFYSRRIYNFDVTLYTADIEDRKSVV